WPTIAEGKPSPHEEILLNATPTSGAIRVGDWKLVLNGHRADGDEAGQSKAADQAKGKGKGKNKAKAKAKTTLDSGRELVEHFNLADAPYEKTNLAEKHPEKVKDLRTRYDALARQAEPPKGGGARPADFASPRVWGEGK